MTLKVNVASKLMELCKEGRAGDYALVYTAQRLPKIIYKTQYSILSLSLSLYIYIYIYIYIRKSKRARESRRNTSHILNSHSSSVSELRQVVMIAPSSKCFTIFFFLLLRLITIIVWNSTNRVFDVEIGESIIVTQKTFWAHFLLHRMLFWIENQ